MPAEVPRSVGPALSGEIITTQLDLSGAINVTPSEQPTGDLSHEIAQKNRLPAWQEGLVAATAAISGLAAAGVPSHASAAERFRALPVETLTSGECIQDDPNATTIHAKISPDDSPLGYKIIDVTEVPNPFVVYVYKEEPVVALADTEQVASLAAKVAGDGQRTDATTADADSQDVEIAIAPGVTIVRAKECAFPKNVDVAQRMFLDRTLPESPQYFIKTDGGKIPLNTYNRSKELSDSERIYLFGQYLGSKTIGNQSYTLFGFEDFQGNRFTVPIELGINQTMEVSYDTLKNNVFTFDEYGRYPRQVRDVIVDLDTNSKGDIVSVFLDHLRRDHGTEDKIKAVNDNIAINLAFFRFMFDCAHNTDRKGSYENHKPPKYVNLSIDEAVNRNLELPTTVALLKYSEQTS